MLSVKGVPPEKVGDRVVEAVVHVVLIAQIERQVVEKEEVLWRLRLGVERSSLSDDDRELMASVALLVQVAKALGCTLSQCRSSVPALGRPVKYSLAQRDFLSLKADFLSSPNKALSDKTAGALLWPIS